MADKIIAELRVCTKCGQAKPLREYTLTSRDERLPECKVCVHGAKRKRQYEKWREKHPKLPPREPLMSENGRLCRTCDTRKDPVQFRADKRNKNGLAWRCKDCQDADQKRWNSENPERVRDYKRKQQRAYYANNPEKYREILRRSRLRTKYGLEFEELKSLVELQHGGCKICDRPMTIFAPGNLNKANVACVDHDHATKKIRGILCSYCNRALGLFQDNPILLDKAAAYLRGNGK